jgi:hypothetical protein
MGESANLPRVHRFPVSPVPPIVVRVHPWFIGPEYLLILRVAGSPIHRFVLGTERGVKRGEESVC